MTCEHPKDYSKTDDHNAEPVLKVYILPSRDERWHITGHLLVNGELYSLSLDGSKNPDGFATADAAKQHRLEIVPVFSYMQIQLVEPLGAP